MLAKSLLLGVATASIPTQDFFAEDHGFFQNASGKDCWVPPQTSNIVNQRSLWKNYDASKIIGVNSVDANFDLNWPGFMQIYRKFEARMRIDFVNEVYVPNPDFDDEQLETVSSSYFVHYLSDADNDIALQTIFYDEEMQKPQFQSISNFRDMSESIIEGDEAGVTSTC